MCDQGCDPFDRNQPKGLKGLTSELVIPLQVKYAVSSLFSGQYGRDVKL